MIHIKKFEDIEEDISIEDKLSQLAIYFEDKLNMTKDDGYIDCLWSDINLDRNIIEFEFDFNAETDEETEDKINDFLSQYDEDYKCEYKFYSGDGFYKTGHYIYTIKIDVSDIEKLYQDSEIYNSTKKYNL